MTVNDAQKKIRATLPLVFEEGEAHAAERLIFEDMMGLTPVDVAIAPERELPDFMEPKLDGALRRLRSGEPIQYVLGHARFYGLDLEVTPATLIPRPETEELVDLIVKRHGKRSDLRVLDICTGSGCIALAIARTLKFAQVTAIDLSAPALEVAQRNALRLHASIDFRQADALNPDNLPDRCWDIIVSNPPYVLQSEAADMDPRVLDHEPHIALFVPDSDPMRFYRSIETYASRHLAPGGMLYFEINPLCAAKFTGADLVNDIHGRKRFAIYDFKK